MLQWTADWAEGYGWHDQADFDRCEDCAALTPGTRRVFRGGSYQTPWPFANVRYRNWMPPETRSHYYGVRCARTP
jgi:formylglycine-generating enzyme required for sulfatase activity